MEPLFNSWYAWPLLIAPETAALLSAYHLRLLESFVEAPAIHRDAVKRSALRGGPFVDYHGEVDRIARLAQFVKTELAEVLEFADNVKVFARKLRNEATGSSLAPFYEQMPAGLRGYVELTYDVTNVASLRFIEPLLYRSRLYRADLQSLALSESRGDQRPFALSTPRVDKASAAHLRLSFDSDCVGALLAARERPLSRELLEHTAASHLDPQSDKELLRLLFTPDVPRKSPDRNFAGDGVRVRYFGHATLLIETRTLSLLTDPIVSYGDPAGPPRYTFADLPDRIDFVLLTHAHQDHVMFETLLQLRHKVGAWIVPRSCGGILSDPSLKLLLQAVGFRNVIELDEMETLRVEGGAITGVPFLGEHGDLHIRAKIAYHLRLGRSTFLILADSCNLDDTLYARVHEHLGDVEQLFIGMECEGAPMSWLYGPLMIASLDRKHDQSRRLNGSDAERAARIVRRFKPQSVFVYAMGQEPWLKFISSIEYTQDSAPIRESSQLLKTCHAEGRESERLYCKRELLYP